MAKLASPTDKRRKFRAILKRKQLTVHAGRVLAFVCSPCPGGGV